MGGQEYGGEVKWDVWTFRRNVSKLSCVRVRGRREKRKDARGGPPGYPKGTAFIVVGREKKKRKKRGVRDPRRITCTIYTVFD